ncbi:MAG: hypothetical protein KAH38_05210 [Candidatus Hydrogenedentes bacterium]|nr:hypothetical protein [Candidatus Hydrogenedentota bacterium]
MKNIDDKMIEKALRNIKKIRRFKPVYAIYGIVQLVLAGLFAMVTLPFVLNPRPEDSSAEIAIFVTFTTMLAGLNFGSGLYYLLLGLSKNYKDAIIERLAEQYLQQKKAEENME